MAEIKTDADVLDILWRLYRGAVTKHIDRDELPAGETEAQYRERAEKAGLIAVANFVIRAEREG
jgi:hypothetical protein